MKNFIKDYADLCKQLGVFCKKHWKEILLLNATVIASEFLWFYKDRIKESFESKLS